MSGKQSNKPYQKLDVINADEVKDWQRRTPKWKDLVDDVLNLEPGQALPVVFPTKKEANRARNAVRDWANRILKQPIIRTRLKVVNDNKVIISLIRDYTSEELKALRDKEAAEKNIEQIE